MDQACSIKVLMRSPETGSIRFMIFSYKEVWIIDRQVLDQIANGPECRALLSMATFRLPRTKNRRTFPAVGKEPHHSSACRYHVTKPIDGAAMDIFLSSFWHLSRLLVCPASQSTGATTIKASQIQIHSQNARLIGKSVLVFVRNGEEFTLTNLQILHPPGPAQFAPSQFTR